MKKRTKKTIQIFLLILVVILLFLFCAYKYYEYSKIRERNIIIYSSVKCVSECPLVFNETYNMNLFELSCQKECTKENNYSLVDIWEKKTIANSEEFSLCEKMYYNSKSYEELQKCFKDILPKLKEKYPYLENSNK